MFRLTDKPIKPAELAVKLNDPEAGAMTSFEGWVRRRNLSRGVERLEYEAADSLCAAEAAWIIAEARTKFRIRNALAVHRVGMLEIGDIAVWVGATAAHRDDAFRACRYIIDQIKSRLPIWKKEHYVGAPPDWIDPTENPGGTAVETGSDALELSENERGAFARQMRLPGVGEAGQLKLLRATALVVGAGGLGCPALQYLAAAGVGRILVCDGDVVEASNLHRQILFDAADVGLPKAEIAAEKIRRLAPSARIEPVIANLDADNAARLIKSADVVLDGSDNFATRFLVHDACRLLGVPLVHAAAHQFEGQIMVFDPAAGPGCLRCLYPETPEEGCAGDCATAGIFGPATGALGAMQAAEAIKTMLGMPSDLKRGALQIDLAEGRTRFIERAVNPDCPLCGAHPQETKFDPANYRNGGDGGVMDAAQWHKTSGVPRQIIDVRASDERAGDPGWFAREVLALPPDSDVLRALDANAEYLVVCSRGLVSRRLVRAMRAAGRHNYFALEGGLPALVRWRNRQ